MTPVEHATAEIARREWGCWAMMDESGSDMIFLRWRGPFPDMPVGYRRDLVIGLALTGDVSNDLRWLFADAEFHAKQIGFDPKRGNPKEA